jgi:hypothetical protein
MLQPKAVFVKPIENYHLFLRFETGEEAVFDVNPYISGVWFEKLKDENYFKTVRIANQTVEWKNGQDISPHELYELSEKIS